MLPDNGNSKLYYTIGEVAKMFEVSTSRIRYYEQQFDILKPHKNKKGNRLFTKKDVEHLTTIFKLIREDKLTLSQVRLQLQKGTDQSVCLDEKETLKESLLHLRKLLSELKDTL